MFAVFVGAGRLGADVGGVITVGAGIAAATVLMLPGHAVAAHGPARCGGARSPALVALAALDLATGGNGHFTRTILQAESAASLWDVVTRRYTLAFNVLKTGAMPFITLLALLAAAYARALPPARSSPRWRTRPHGRRP